MIAVLDTPMAELEKHSDEEVVRMVLEGKIELYELLMRRHNRRLYRVSRSIVKTDAEAEDLMQDTYVRAYANLHQFRGGAKFSTWLTKIAVYQGFARVRRERRVQPIDDINDQGSEGILLRDIMGDPEQSAAREQMKKALESAIGTLPPIYRSVFVLRYVEGVSASETAECLETTEEAVKMRLHRAKAALRRYFFESFGIAGPDLFSFHLDRCDRVVANVLGRLNLPPYA